MSKVCALTGLVVHVTPFNDNAVVACILTPEKKTSFMIKGALKPDKSTFKLGKVLTQISFNATVTQEDRLSTLTEGVVLDNYGMIKTNIKAYNYTLAIIEKMYHFADNVSDYKLFYKFGLDILSKINKEPENVLAYVNIFEIKTLYLMGIAPTFKECMICNKPIKDGVLVVSLGGYICDECSLHTKTTLTKEQSNLFRYAYSTKLENITSDKVMKLNNIYINNSVDYFYQYHLDYYSKVKKVLKSLDL